METDSHNFIFEVMCMHQIYGRCEELPKRLDLVMELQKFLFFNVPFFLIISVY